MNTAQPKPPVRVFKLGEEPPASEFWLTKSMPERLDALLDLSNDYHGWNDKNQPRIQRVLIVRRQAKPA